MKLLSFAPVQKDYIINGISLLYKTDIFKLRRIKSTKTLCRLVDLYFTIDVRLWLNYKLYM